MQKTDYKTLFSLSAEHAAIKDSLGRSPFFTYKGENIFSPSVSELIYNSGFNPKYPDGKSFAVCLSHDVDALYAPEPMPKYFGGFRNVFDISKFEVKRRLRMTGTKSLNESWSLERTLEIENRYAVTSTFYFLSLGEQEQDFNYDVFKIGDQFKMVKDAHCEIGLHGGHKAYNSQDKILEEKSRLAKAAGVDITGYRNHYLRFVTPDSWNHLAAAGLKYDTTLGYSTCAGFRNGMCYPFFPYDNAQKKFIDIVELPLIVMDVTLLNYMKLDAATAFTLFKALCQKVKAINGVFTLLWHNEYMTGEWGKFYEQCIGHLNSEDAWFTTSAGVVDWYEKNNYLEQVKNIITSEVI